MKRLPVLTLISTTLLIGLVSPELPVQAQTSADQAVDRTEPPPVLFKFRLLPDGQPRLVLVRQMRRSPTCCWQMPRR